MASLEPCACCRTCLPQAWQSCQTHRTQNLCETHSEFLREPKPCWNSYKIGFNEKFFASPPPKDSSEYSLHWLLNIKKQIEQGGVHLSFSPSCFLCRWIVQGWPLPSPSGGCLALLMFRICLSA